MRKKIYFMAVNWDQIDRTNERFRYVISTEAIEGNDIAGFTECYAYKDGWRIYSYTTRKARDAMVQTTLRGNKTIDNISNV